MRAFICCILMGALAPVCLAAPAPPPNEPGLDADSRLAKKVVLRQDAAPLSDVLARLSRDTGVSIRAAEAVKGEPAVVFVADVPAREVMRQLASLFDYRWRATGTASAPVYTLEQTEEGARREEALRQRDRTRAVDALREELRQLAAWVSRGEAAIRAEVEGYDAAMSRLSSAPEAQRRELAATPEYRLLIGRTAKVGAIRQLLDPVTRDLVLLGAGLTLEQWTGLMTGSTRRFSTARESGAWPVPGVAATALQASRVEWLPAGVTHYSVPLGPNADRKAIPPKRHYLADPWIFRVRARLDLRLAHGGAHASLNLIPAALLPDRNLKQRAGLIVAADVPAELPPATALAEPPLVAQRRMRAPAVSPVDPQGGWFTRTLPVLAETYGLNLVADGYRGQRLAAAPNIFGQELTLTESLSRVVRPNGEYTRHGDFIRVRRIGWYSERLAEFSPARADEWAARLRSAGEFSLECGAELARELRPEQAPAVEALLRERGVRVSALTEVLRNREVLLAYAGCSSGQRSRLVAGGTIRYAEMSLETRRHLQRALDEWRAERFSDPPAGTRPVGLLTLSVVNRPPVRPSGTTDEERSGEPLLRESPLRELRFTYQHSDALSAEFFLRLPRLTLVAPATAG